MALDSPFSHKNMCLQWTTETLALLVWVTSTNVRGLVWQHHSDWVYFPAQGEFGICLVLGLPQTSFKGNLWRILKKREGARRKGDAHVDLLFDQLIVKVTWLVWYVVSVVRVYWLIILFQNYVCTVHGIFTLAFHSIPCIYRKLAQIKQSFYWATSHELGPQKVAEVSGNPYFREIIEFPRTHLLPVTDAGSCGANSCQDSWLHGNAHRVLG